MIAHATNSGGSRFGWATSTRLVLFDIDGTLIDTGGAGARSWTWAFERQFGQNVDIAEHSTAGMTDPAIGRVTFSEAMGREPSAEELARLMASYQAVLPDFVASSPDYEVLEGVEGHDDVGLGVGAHGEFAAVAEAGGGSIRGCLVQNVLANIEANHFGRAVSRQVESGDSVAASEVDHCLALNRGQQILA